MSWNRKDQHIHYAEMQYQQQSDNGLDQVRFVHQSFSEMSINDVNLTTKLGSLSLDYPFFINAMTGGSDKAHVINKNLALIAKETNLAMAVGSVSTAIKNPELADSFKVVRKMNPNGILFSNLGAHHSLENAKIAVDMIEADAIQIHLNTPQEIVMPEGDRNFTNWLSNIEEIVKELHVPVIVKEVGFGMSKETIQQLIDIGVTMIDVGGRGGTNFVHIENERRNEKEFDYLLNWGQNTAESLLEAHFYRKQADFIASGGIRNPLHMLAAFGLGAKVTGISGEFLHMVLTKGNESTINRVNEWKYELSALMALVGAKSIEDIEKKALVLSPELNNWCKERRILFNHN
ncbi:type 2 isopentenyl-diphosphate Delta-isomerase [Vagococcus fluvialis]|uniref:type 2 isopentenyl-diphosphate Delta-isomerase n=1 Tax=Vagococcus fluvialis TaxID=2738 RepID=UPI001A8EED6E|nr:type 2 isopentenyl-diphosphate Delta-isomerase [Vagococcus fluvialis]MBO0487504.1 type 2 isopentenyl-diphosphate Delta-isomerase [Vagococcus fluvialis]MCM2139991.1 type 2 isopentenyl-diphosphate Delta-isomerase [Vagococcus fluvialis]MDT2780936.1 type 2 isopentenyl-diphosphate Delta-isomerase [Vagococcus fluvialis]